MTNNHFFSSATDSFCSWDNYFATDATMKPFSPASVTDITLLASRDIFTLSKLFDCEVVVADISFLVNNTATTL